MGISILMMQAPVFVLGFIFFLFIVAIIAYLVHVFVREQREEQDFYSRGREEPTGPSTQPRSTGPFPPTTYTRTQVSSDEEVLRDLTKRLDRIEKEIAQLGDVAEESKTTPMPTLASKVTPTIEPSPPAKKEPIHEDPKQLKRITELEGELEAIAQLLDELEEKREQKEISDRVYEKLKKKYLEEQKSIKSELKKLS